MSSNENTWNLTVLKNISLQKTEWTEGESFKGFKNTKITAHISQNNFYKNIHKCTQHILNVAVKN